MISKFRVWSTVKKAMSEVQAIVYAEERVYPIYSKVVRRYVPFSEAILMQSTGLFDDTGQEIFEGDVVLVMSEEFGPDTAIVKSDNFGFYLEYLDMDIFPERLNELKLEIKVIGNIHENPDLVVDL